MSTTRRKLLKAAASFAVLPIATLSEFAYARRLPEVLEPRQGKVQLLPDPYPETAVRGYGGTGSALTTGWMVCLA